MAFRLPTFNLRVNIWHPGTPVTFPPDVEAFANLTPGRRTIQVPLGSSQTPVEVALLMESLLPALTDVRNPTVGPTYGHMEIPSGSGRMYFVLAVDDVAKGFPNEHRIAIVVMVTSPIPIP